MIAGKLLFMLQVLGSADGKKSSNSRYILGSSKYSTKTLSIIKSTSNYLCVYWVSACSIRIPKSWYTFPVLLVLHRLMNHFFSGFQIWWNIQSGTYKQLINLKCSAFSTVLCASLPLILFPTSSIRHLFRSIIKQHAQSHILHHLKWMLHVRLYLLHYVVVSPSFRLSVQHTQRSTDRGYYELKSL